MRELNLSSVNQSTTLTDDKQFILILERTQVEKDEAERDLKMILEKKALAEEEMAKQSHAIRQRELEEEKEINKFRTLASEKEKTIQK